MPAAPYIASLLLGSMLAAGCQHSHRVFAVRLASQPASGAAQHARFHDSRRVDARRGSLATARRRRSFRSRRQLSHRRPRINLNHASLGQLLRLPGMRRREAERILRALPLANKRLLLTRALVTPAQYRRWQARLVARQ
jgi:hypothetical protein